MVQIKCRRCGKTYELPIEEKDIVNYITGPALIQDAFPQLTTGERELIKTRICPTCWDKMFDDPDEL